MERSERPVIGFLTDFGLDGAAATCRGVMLGICRDAQVVDISHTVRKFAVRDGAFILRAALPYLPVGVHVGVVDPGVGTERRPVALRVGRGDVLVGPDNGLLPPAAEALGGIVEARLLDNRALWRPETSHTFHGRDIFAPVAAHLAAGTARFEEVGPPLPAAELVRLAPPEVRVGDGALGTEVTYVDSFGNLRMAGRRDDLAAALGPLGERIVLRVTFEGDPPVDEMATFVTSFGGVPEGAALVYIDSSGEIAFADNQRDAARRLGVGAGRRVRIGRA